MVAEFMEFETPNEPQMGTVSSIQDKYNSMMLDLNDDLQDEIVVSSSIPFQRLVMICTHELDGLMLK